MELKKTDFIIFGQLYKFILMLQFYSRDSISNRFIKLKSQRPHIWPNDQGGPGGHGLRGPGEGAWPRERKAAAPLTGPRGSSLAWPSVAHRRPRRGKRPRRAAF